ncbi:helix-turn-helix domain-containing protein [Parahaliea mediterranea]|uniref:Helix-turn-helix transcriptional regulator n=1 Tax=Parahaliea mediterranea TaxID=651086 RepID=A0A939DIV8_9GAMM|nr:helix-turn-helix transcriptional regulator [Parahaliea mediterranea]MBN7798656.1 helix-turn-helix transcriptional regulator [Parahaliea mediterranea]
MSDSKPEHENRSLFDALMRLSGQVAGGTLELARSTATLTAMFGESWLRNALLNTMEPERLEAMADAGHFLRDARETAGMSLKELADSLGVSDKRILEDVESGDKIMPLELVLRCASLLARHDPIPFLIKFMRTYNPQLEQTLESWGVMALPKQYERERRFINLYRKHDVLRGFSDEEFQRFIDYMESSSNLVLDVMAREKDANTPRRQAAKPPARKRAAGAARKRPAAARKTPKSRAKPRAEGAD